MAASAAKLRRLLARSIVIGGLGLAASSESVLAQTTWTNGAGGGTWSTPLNWDMSAEPLATDDVFLPTPIPALGSPITLSAGELANSLTINDAYLLSGGDLTNTTGQITVASAITAQIDSTLSGSNGLIKLGTGNLVLGGAASYTGLTQINAGTLTLGVNNALPTTEGLAIGNGTTIGNFNMNGFNQTVSSLNIEVHSTSVNTITIGTGTTLTVNGANSFKVGVPGSSARRTNATFTGGGALSVNNTSGIIDIGRPAAGDSSSDNITNVNLKGLSDFTANVDLLRLGFDFNNSATLSLSDTSNTITANSIRIADTNGHNGGNSTLVLGAGTNILSSTSFILGKNKSAGTIKFDALDTTGTVTLQSKTAGNASFIIGSSETSTTGASPSGTLDLSGHDSIVKASTITLGQRNDSSTGSASGTIEFDTGTFTASTINAGIRSSSGSGVATGTINLGGGTMTIGTLNMAANTSTTATTGIKAIADVNVSGGTLNVNTSFKLATQSGAGMSTAAGTLNITGGTVSSNVNIIDGGGNATSTITLDGGTLNLNSKNIGDGTNPIDVLELKSGTLSNVAEINGGGAITKSTAGTLILAGSNTFTSPTTVAEGILLVNGTHTGGGLYTVDPGATLGGTGSLGANVAIAGILSPGASIESLNVTGNVSFDTASLLRIELNDADTNIVDLLEITGDLGIASGAAIDFVVTGTPTASQYLFGTYTGSLTGLFSSVTVPAGYTLVQGGGELKLVNAIPEPSTFVLGAFGLGLIAIVRSRRQRSC